MHELPAAIPDLDLLLSLEPEELGAKMLFLLRQREQDEVGYRGVFAPSDLISELWQNQDRYPAHYPRQQQAEVESDLIEAWA